MDYLPTSIWLDLLSHPHSLALPAADPSQTSTLDLCTDPFSPLDDPDDGSCLPFFPLPLLSSSQQDDALLWDRLELAAASRQPADVEDPSAMVSQPAPACPALSAGPPGTWSAEAGPSKPSKPSEPCSVVRIHSRQPHARSDKPVEITLEVLCCHFHESLEVAAAKIGIGKSTMKLVCRQLGVRQWPYKQIGARGSRLK